MADLEEHDTRVPRGMIDPVGTAQRIWVARHKPPARLAPFADNIWMIEWNLTGRPPEIQKVLPAPNANLVIGAGQTKLFGVIRGVHGRSLEGGRENGPQRAEALAREVGMTVRTMQRLFREYVGVSPKWVIRRYRLQEAAWRLAQGTNEPLSELAASLGYFDQAHLARDFPYCRMMPSTLGRDPSPSGAAW